MGGSFWKLSRRRCSLPFIASRDRLHYLLMVSSSTFKLITPDFASAATSSAALDSPTSLVHCDGIGHSWLIWLNFPISRSYFNQLCKLCKGTYSQVLGTRKQMSLRAIILPHKTLGNVANEGHAEPKIFFHVPYWFPCERLVIQFQGLGYTSVHLTSYFCSTSATVFPLKLLLFIESASISWVLFLVHPCNE